MVTVSGEWQISRSVIAPVLHPGGLFKTMINDKLKVAQLSTNIEEIDVVTLNYWLVQFDWPKSRERDIHRRPFME